MTRARDLRGGRQAPDSPVDPAPWRRNAYGDESVGCDILRPECDTDDSPATGRNETDRARQSRAETAAGRGIRWVPGQHGGPLGHDAESADLASRAESMFEDLNAPAWGRHFRRRALQVAGLEPLALGPQPLHPDGE